MERAIVLLSHGFADNGSWVRKAELRQLNGHDEELLAEISFYPTPLKTTALLGRVVTFGKLTAELDVQKAVQNLTVGDRINLILNFRKFTFGETLNCVLNCPACTEAMSFDLSVISLLQPAMPDPRSEYFINVDNFVLKVKPVTGADIEAVTKNNYTSNPVEQLARACIISSDPPLPDKLSDDFLAKVSSKLEELDPQADLSLNLTCPACQHSFQTSFNAEEYFFQEIDGRQKQLEREVHWLAFNYHWSEDSILSLPLAKRKRYIELINSTLAGESL